MAKLLTFRDVYGIISAREMLHNHFYLYSERVLYKLNTVIPMKRLHCRFGKMHIFNFSVAIQNTMIVDVTCAPSQIKYPQDTELLNEAREITEKDIDELHIPGNGKEITQSYRSAAFIYQKKFTETEKIRHIVQNEKFVFPDRLSIDPRKTKFVIKSKITLMNRNG